MPKKVGVMATVSSTPSSSAAMKAASLSSMSGVTRAASMACSSLGGNDSDSVLRKLTRVASACSDTALPRRANSCSSSRTAWKNSYRYGCRSSLRITPGSIRRCEVRI